MSKTDTNRLTPKQIHFCQAVASGCTMSDAYREAYNTSNMKPASIHREAHTLMADPKITARVERLQRQKDRAVVASSLSDRERVLTKLRDMMNSAKAENVQLGAAVALGKTIALFTDVTEDRSVVKDIDQIDREIEQRMAEIEAEMKV